MTDLIVPVPDSAVTFAARDRCVDLHRLDADIAIIGVPYGIPYPAADPAAPTPSAGPAAIRAGSQRYGRFFDHHDIDLGGSILNHRPIRIVDCGDVVGTPDGGATNHARTEEAIRLIRNRGAVPIVLGGDDSIPIPVMRGLDGDSDIELMHFDAHLDFRDEVYGIRDGWSSSIRRAAEMDHIGHITQIGVRGAGSARVQDVEDVIANGNRIISARTIEERGSEAVAHELPPMKHSYIAFDMDVMDPSIAPGVASTAFGGLTYWQASDMLQFTAERSIVIGANFTEVNPALDLRGITPVLTARLILNLIAAMARSDQFAHLA